MLETESGVGPITIVTAGRTLVLATTALRDHPTNPEKLFDFQDALWKLNRFAMGLSERDVAVADCPWSEDEIRKFMGVGKFNRVVNPDFGLFLPEICSTAPEGLQLQNKAYPEMFWEEQGVPASVRNEDEEGNVISLFGWLKTERSIDAPYTGTDETRAKQLIADRNKEGQIRKELTLNAYGAAGQESKLLSKENKYLDEVRTWVRILASRSGGRVVGADFGPDGYCYVLWFLGSSTVVGRLGVRSVGV